MSNEVPIGCAEVGEPVDDELVAVWLPVDVVDELMVATLWLSLQLGHRLPVAVLRRALVRDGVAHAGRVLARLREGRPPSW